MAGGAGERLRPLTAELPKPALPFAGGYRIIDFALSNLYNSLIRSVFVLLQYRPQALLDHLAKNWAFANTVAGEFIKPVLPERNGPQCRFRGTADAVHQSLDLLDGHGADLVAVFAADHVHRMDVRQMTAFHEARSAAATVAAVPVSVDQPRGSA
jgi:glucose-1-phosphate adenylyltransferase